MDNRIFINPSILNANFDDLEGEIDRVAKHSDQLHLDIMDNKFVPNFTFDFKRALEIIAFSKLPVDAHLMIEDVDVLGPKYAENGCDSVTIHYEAARNVRQTLSNIKSNGSKAGLAIKPGTDFSQIEEFINELDLLLIMTVEPGFGGQSFMTDQMEKVLQARSYIDAQAKAVTLLQVDGGISESTIEIAAKAGANCFVAGSAVYKSPDPAETIVKLRSLASNSFRG